MTWYSNLAIRKKLAVGFGALLLITLLFGLFSLAQMASINSATEEIASRRMFAVRYLTTIRGDVNATRRTELTWLLVLVQARNLNVSVTFTATVTTSGANPPTGTVTFYDGTTILGNGTTLNGSQVSTST